ncbi:Gramicidin S synthase 1 [compost metagenome]
MLGVEKVGINDNYFLLGGDSIKSIQIVSRLARYNRKLQVKHFMLYPTIAECAQYMEYIEDKKTCQDPVAGELPLTPIQRWFFEQSFTEPNHWNQSMMLYREQGWNPELVDKVFHRLVAHHDALRMRFVRESGSVRQINAGIEGSHFLLEVCKVGKDETEAEIERLANMLQAKMKLEEALVRLGLYQTEDGDHLLIAIHHLVVDGVSWRILLEDFMHLYDAMLKDEPASLPEKTDSYMEWSRKLVEPATLAKLAAEKDYWRDVEKQAAQLSYAGRRPCAIADSRTAGFQLNEAMTRKLLTEANRAYHTEVTDLLLTALALAYGERSDEGVAIHLEGHGREEFMEGMDLTRTVGWFTSIYPVVLPAPASEPGETVPVIKELIRNIPNKGAGYSILKYAGAASQDNPIPSGFQPEAVFNYLGQFGTSASSGGFDPSPMPMGSLINELNSMTHLQEWNCVVSEGRFQLTFRYDPSAMGDSEAIQLLESYSRHLQALIEHCLAQDTEQFTPSDFSDDDLTFEELDEISDMLRKLE